MFDVYALGKSTALTLTAGQRGSWTLTVIVDGECHEFTGKNIAVSGWEYKLEVDDGATAAGPLAALNPSQG